jgi:hypothetical protein
MDWTDLWAIDSGEEVQLQGERGQVKIAEEQRRRRVLSQLVEGSRPVETGLRARQLPILGRITIQLFQLIAEALKPRYLLYMYVLSLKKRISNFLPQAALPRPMFFLRGAATATAQLGEIIICSYGRASGRHSQSSVELPFPQSATTC